MAKKSLAAGKAEFKAIIAKRAIPLPGRPIEADLARAKALMAAQMKLWSSVRERVQRSITGRAMSVDTPSLASSDIRLHDILFFPGNGVDHSVYVFFETNANVAAARECGLEQAFRDTITQEFAALSPSACTVEITFDAYENVQKKYNGNYRQYLG